MLRFSHNFLFGLKHIDFFKASSHRFLYSKSVLGIDTYLEEREKSQRHISNNVEMFRSKMNKILKDSSISMIFADDLKKMVLFAETDNKNDVELLIKMVKKVNIQNKEFGFNNVNLGPVIMRFFTYAGYDDIALKLFKDPDMYGFFDLLSTLILVDMLYEKKRYNDVINVFETVRSKLNQNAISNVVTLVLAACYKKNTTNSLEYGTKLWIDFLDSGRKPIPQAAYFAAGLALKQNAPLIALEIISSLRYQQSVTTKNIKVLILTELGQFNDILPILRSVDEVPLTETKETFISEVIDYLGLNISKSSDSELVQSYNKIEKHLRNNDHIVDNTLDNLLTAEVQTIGKSKTTKSNTILPSKEIANSRYGKSRYRTPPPNRYELRHLS